MLKEYLNYHAKYTELYGQKTIVIMMVGQFYEIYGVNTDEIQDGPNLNELSDILNIIRLIPFLNKFLFEDVITSHKYT